MSDLPALPQDDGLNEMQRAFVAEYVKDWNGTQAAIRAGYSANSAESLASQLLKLPQVAQALAREKAHLAARSAVSQDLVMAELRKIAFSNVAKAFTVNFELKSLDEIPEDLQQCIQEVTVSTLHTKAGDITRAKVKFYDKIRALELIGRNKDMWDAKDTGAGFTLIVNQTNNTANINAAPPTEALAMGDFIIDVPISPDNTDT